MSLIDIYANVNDIIKVKFKNIAVEPERELKKICKFIGLEYEDEMIEYADKVHHITNGNNMRFKKPSKIILDEAWKENLSSDDLKYFERYGEKLNSKLGYT